MKEDEFSLFKQMVKKVGKYQPKEKPKKPTKVPSVKEVKMEFILDKKSIRIEENK